MGRELVPAALALVAREGGGHVHLWVPKPRASHDEMAEAVGFRPGRELAQMRRTLPVEDHLAKGEPVPVRAFEPGRDEQAWLEVNNRAFGRHPEQGRWDLSTLGDREAQPWF